VITSLGLSGSYKYVLAKKGFSLTMASLGLAFSPFLLSPIAIAFVFKRYVTKLYYDPSADLFTAYHFGYLFRQRRIDFKHQDVVPSPVTSILNTFSVRGRPFFIHDEDLIDSESVKIYRRMMGLDEVGENTKDNEIKVDEKV